MPGAKVGETFHAKSLQEVLMINWNCLVNCQVELMRQASLAIVVPGAVAHAIMLTARRSRPALPLDLLLYLSHRLHLHADDLAFVLQCEPRRNATRCWHAGV